MIVFTAAPYPDAAEPPLAATIRASRAVQARWADEPMTQRLTVIRTVRRLLVARGDRIAGLSGRRGPRARAETLAAEVLPLADALRFLEREAPRILKPTRVGSRLPWGRTRAQIRRAPLGVVLVIAPGNYPLFLPGVQTAQALVAGNGVLLKPAPGGKRAAFALQSLFLDAGLPPDLLVVLPEDVEAGRTAIAQGVDHVVLTGSATTGRAVLRDLAPRLTSSTLELSGCDAVFVRPDADLALVARALRFGLSLNGSRTCIAPRRVFVPPPLEQDFLAALKEALASVPPTEVDARTESLVTELATQALGGGARIAIGSLPSNGSMGPLVLDGVSAGMEVARSDVFAPLLSVIRADGDEDALVQADCCPYALGATVFGKPESAWAFAQRVRAGVVLVNDMIAPTADPRVPFGGRGESGYGTTRGAEGLLALTSPRAIVETRRGVRRHLDGLRGDEDPLFLAWLRAAHAGSVLERLKGALALVREGMRYARATRELEDEGDEASE